MAKIHALQVHSYHGKEYQPGDTYDADEGDVVTIEVQGKGARVDASHKAHAAHGSHPVEPLTTHDVHAKHKK